MIDVDRLDKWIKNLYFTFKLFLCKQITCNLFCFSKGENKSEKKSLKTKMTPVTFEESHIRIQGQNPNLYKKLKSKMHVSLKCGV